MLHSRLSKGLLLWVVSSVSFRPPQQMNDISVSTVPQDLSIENVITQIVTHLLYILEPNPHPNLIRTSFCRFLKRKKLFRVSNPQLLQKSCGGFRLHGKPSRRALSSDLWRSVTWTMFWKDPKMTVYGRTMVKIKMILTGWRITIQLWVMTASLINNKL